MMVTQISVNTGIISPERAKYTSIGQSPMEIIPKFN